MSDISSSLSPWLILGAFLLYSILHSILASVRVKGWARRMLGDKAFERSYRFIFNSIGTLTLLPILWLVAVLPNRALYMIPFPWRWLSVAGQALGLWILLRALRQTGALEFLGLRQLSGGGKNAESELHTGGLYAYMRHPLYTGAMLFLWLAPMMTANYLALVLSVSLYFWLGAYFEERKLRRVFGQEYAEYQARTAMFFPLPFIRR